MKKSTQEHIKFLSLFAVIFTNLLAGGCSLHPAYEPVVDPFNNSKSVHLDRDLHECKSSDRYAYEACLRSRGHKVLENTYAASDSSGDNFSSGLAALATGVAIGMGADPGRSYSGPSNINSYAAISGSSTSNVPNVTLTNPVTECISVERGRLPGQYDNPARSVIVKNNCSYRVLANICFLSADTFGNDCKQVGGINARFIEANSAITWPAPDREVNYVTFACPSDYQMSMVWKGSKVDGKCFTCKSEQCSIENL